MQVMTPSVTVVDDATDAIVGRQWCVCSTDKYIIIIVDMTLMNL